MRWREERPMRQPLGGRTFSFPLTEGQRPGRKSTEGKWGPGYLEGRWKRRGNPRWRSGRLPRRWGGI